MRWRLILFACLIGLALPGFLIRGGGGGGGGTGTGTITPWFWLDNSSLNTATTANANTTIGSVSIPGSGTFTGAIALIQVPYSGFVLSAIAAGCAATTAANGDSLVTCSGATGPAVANLKVGGSNKAAGQYEMDMPVAKSIALPGAGTAVDCSAINWTLGATPDSQGNYQIFKNGAPISTSVDVGVAIVVMADCGLWLRDTPLASGGLDNNQGYWLGIDSNAAQTGAISRPYEYHQFVSLSTGVIAADNTVIAPYSGQTLITNLTGNLSWGAQSWYGPVLSSGATDLQTGAVKAGVFNHGVTYMKYNPALPSPAAATRCQATQDYAVKAHIVPGSGATFSDGVNTWSMSGTVDGFGYFPINKNGALVGDGSTLDLGWDGNIYTYAYYNLATNGATLTSGVYRWNGSGFTQIFQVPAGMFREVACPGGF